MGNSLCGLWVAEADHRLPTHTGLPPLLPPLPCQTVEKLIVLIIAWTTPTLMALVCYGWLSNKVHPSQQPPLTTARTQPAQPRSPHIMDDGCKLLAHIRAGDTPRVAPLRRGQHLSHTAGTLLTPG